MTQPAVTILPAQAARISREAAETGGAVGVSQSGSTLNLITGRGIFRIDAGGHNIPNPNQETLPC